MTLETKEDALEALERARSEYLTAARAVAYRLGASREVTVDDVRKYCPPPKEIDGRVMGAIFNTPDWEHSGYTRSTRATCHKRPISKFRRVV